MLKKVAVFPGSFDPPTLGHEDIIERGSVLFNELIVAIGYNSSKLGFFPLEKRLYWLDLIASQYKNVRVASYQGLTVNFLKEVGATVILRGLRSEADFAYENPIALINKKLAPEIETLFLVANPNSAAISSTIVREVYKSGGSLKKLVPDLVVIDLLGG